MAWVSEVRAVVGEHGATLESPAPRLGQMSVTFAGAAVGAVALTRLFGSGPDLVPALLGLAGLAYLLTACSKHMRTTFSRAAGKAVVEARSPCGTSAQEYPFTQIDSLAVTDACVVELQLRDGTTRQLTYANETYPQLDKMVSLVCAATGIAKGSPELARAPSQDREGVLSAPGMGLYIEGRFAILATSSRLLSFRRLMEIVFNRGRREMTVIRSTPLRKSRMVIPLHDVASLGLDGTRDAETGTYTYRPVLRLASGRSIRMFGETRIYAQYDRILARVRELTGIAKEDNIERSGDQWPRLADAREP